MGKVLSLVPGFLKIWRPFLPLLIQDTTLPVSHEPQLKLINKTAHRIAIAAVEPNQLPLIIPPFGLRQINLSLLQQFNYDRWVSQGLISCEALLSAEQTRLQRIKDFREYLINLLMIGLGMNAIAALLVGWSFQILVLFWIGVFFLAGWIVVFLISLGISTHFSKNVSQAVGQLQQAFSLVWVLLIGIGVPGFIIYVSIGGIDILADPRGLNTLLGRGAQFIFIGLTSVLPALLYFLFARQQLDNLRAAFFREVMILDPDVLTVDEAETKYALAIKEIYGSDKAGQLGSAKTLPVVFCTLLLMLGWMSTLQPLGPIEHLDFENIIVAHSSTFNYGFLGSYFFALNMVFRRYLRADLTAKAYSHVTVRILITTILVWAVMVLPSTGWKEFLLPLTFFIGVFPETGMAFFQQILRKGLAGLLPQTQTNQSHPLSDLEGVSLYDQARLLEEGIENVENLAHYSIIELRLSTRISMSRIVDLYDQAILYLHLDYEAEAKDILRRYGIRTATDLEVALKTTSLQDRPAFYGLLEALAASQSVKDLPIKRLKVIMDSLHDDDWMEMLRNWRRVSQGNETIYDPENFYRGRLIECSNCSYANRCDSKYCANCGQSLAMLGDLGKSGNQSSSGLLNPVTDPRQPEESQLASVSSGGGSSARTETAILGGGALQNPNLSLSNN